MGKKLPNVELSQQQLEQEIKRVHFRRRRYAAARTVFYILLMIAAVAVLVTVLWVPALLIMGDSMAPLLESGEGVLAIRTQRVIPGDIIVFQREDRIFVKRVIADGGDWIDIDGAGGVSVNGERVNETYLKQAVLEPNDLTYPYLVPDGCVFVMGDNREKSIDSRLSKIGCISNSQIIGKVCLRIWPLYRLEYLG